MKKITIVILSFLFLWWLCNADLAWFTIEGYTSNFKLKEDWILEVVESININFTERRHWIYRTIPYIYSNYLKTPIKKVKVPWYKFTTEKQWNNFKIKIWSANKTVIWEQNYNINYKVKWSVRKFTGYQELYWNILWTEWNTPVNNYNFSLELPSNLDLKDDDVWVYIWKKWSKDTTKAIKSWNIISNPEPLNLWAREWVTLAVKLPTDYVPTKKYYSLKWRFKYYGKKILISIRGVSTLSLVFFVLRELIRRRKKRKELEETHWREKRDLIYYTPPKWYTAMDVAAIYNWKSNFDIFPAFLYSWIADWYVRIEEEKFPRFGISFFGTERKYNFKVNTLSPEFKFDKVNLNSNHLHFSNPEERFWNLCFIQWDINDLSSFKTKDSDTLKKIADEIFYKTHTNFIKNWKDLYKVKSLPSKMYKYSHIKLTNKIYWKDNPDWNRILNRLIFLIWCIFSWFIIFPLSYTYTEDILLWSAMYASIGSILYFIFKTIKSLYNSIFNWKFWWDFKFISKEWIEAIEQISWFRKYLLHVDSDKLKTLLNEDPTYFEKNLPYAIALDIWKYWIKKCMHILEDIDYSPKWISTSDDNRWTAIWSKLSIWNNISSTVHEIDHPRSSWWSWWSRWSSWWWDWWSSWWSSWGWSSWWWGWGGWWWSW